MTKKRMSSSRKVRNIPPKEAENPDHTKGIERIRTFVFEALDPYSGEGLTIVETEPDIDVSVLVCCAYIIKAVLWMVMPSFIKERI